MDNININYKGSVDALNVKQELDTTIKAAFSWLDQYIVFKGIVDVEVVVSTTPTGRFGGCGSVHHYLSKVNGTDTWENASITESRTGIDEDPITPEFTILVDPYSDYVQKMWWDTTPLSFTKGEIPINKLDAFSVVLHEIIHGMGINGWLDRETGEHTRNYQSIWDSLISITDGKAYFNGSHVKDLLGEPLEVRLGGTQGGYHLGAIETQQPYLLSSIMNGYFFYNGERYLPAQLEFSILKDLGWTLKPSVSNIANIVDQFDNKSLAEFSKNNNTESDNTIIGTSLNDTLNGLTGNDTLIGASGHDFLDGGDGNDNLDGGFDNDDLRGGSGNDKLRAGFGFDSLTGGGGNDIFSFYAPGYFTVRDFDKSSDLLFLESSTGLLDIEGLLKVITRIEDHNGYVTVHFINDIASINLIGLLSSDLSADMVAF